MSKLKSLTEADMVEGIRREDDAIMSKVYKMYYPVIEHFIITNGGLAEEAKDIYQEAFIVLYENLQQSTFELTCKIKTYLYSVSRRLWLKRFNFKVKYQAELKDSEEYILFDEDNTIEKAVAEEMRFNIMEDALNKLGEPCRTILIDFYINDFNMVQIAEKMGYTNADNAKTQKYKCLMRLKKLVGNEQVMPNSENYT
jgi:RNA polymerase sigma factor (sigma-70 family)